MDEHDNPFSPGDWVECVDPAMGRLSAYRVYQVRQPMTGQEDLVHVMCDDCVVWGFSPRRFRAALGNPKREKAVPERDLHDHLRDLLAYIDRQPLPRADADAAIGFLRGYFGITA